MKTYQDVEIHEKEFQVLEEIKVIGRYVSYDSSMDDFLDDCDQVNVAGTTLCNVYGKDIPSHYKEINEEDVGFCVENGHITKLSYYNFDLGKLPESLGNLTHLRELYLRDNNIWQLPKSIGQLENLEILDLSTNGYLQSLPASICKLRNLKELNLQRCRNLWDLPSNIGDLENLEYLHLLWTNIKKLPESIKNLQRLKEKDFFKLSL